MESGHFQGSRTVEIAHRSAPRRALPLLQLRARAVSNLQTLHEAVFLPSRSRTSPRASTPVTMPPSVAHDPPPEAVDCAYLNEAWTPYHAVLASCRRLAAAGYEVRDRIDRSPLLLSAGAHMHPIQRPSRLRPPSPPLLVRPASRRSPRSFSSPRRFRFPLARAEISERDAWALKPGGKYFFTRNMSALCAFAVGAKYAPARASSSSARTRDSPCPPPQAVHEGEERELFLQVRTQNYGGGLWYTWFDRDLGVAGRVLVRRPDAETPGESRVSHELVKIERPVMRIPSLAIHLDRSLNDGFKVNFQQHMAPVIADAVEAELGAGPQTKTPADETRAETKKRRVESSDKHHPVLLDLLAEALGCEREDVLDFELQLCDTQPSAVGGAKGEYIFSGRLDNLQSCYCSLTALIAASSDESLEDETAIRMIAHYDHEEVGSDSAQGAGSSMTEDALRRVVRPALNVARGLGFAPSAWTQAHAARVLLRLRGHGARGAPELRGQARARAPPPVRRGGRDQAQREPEVRDGRGDGIFVPRARRARACPCRNSWSGATWGAGARSGRR